ncbi:MAG TPA: diguanylate cyclase [Thermoleophilaceae bacterium]|nr:diguanylate cyclase [Thermoleophilaceae bacterium]
MKEPSRPPHGLRRRTGRPEPVRAGEPRTPAGEPRDAGSERDALIRVAAAAAGAHRLDQVLELAAEEARRVLSAASLAVSRWERDRNVLETLINVGALGPGESRYPEDETYPVAPGSVIERLVRHGQPYFNSVGDPAADRDSVELLKRLGKDSEVAVPIVVEGETWGEVWAATAGGGRRFRAADIRFLEAVAGQLAVAIGRAELFSRVSRLAYEDSLTGLANRRAVEERLERALERARRRGSEVALVLCDLDNLKAINDERGHEAGDRALKRVAEALVAAAADHPGSLVGRLSGDEFCVLLEGQGVDAAHEVGAAAVQILEADRDLPTSISCGATSVQGPGASRGRLLRSADAAQYAAKRMGGGQVCTAAPDLAPTLRDADRRLFRGDAERRLLAAADLLTESLAGELAGRATLDRLEVVATTLSQALNAAGWTVSYAPAGGSLVRSLSNAHTREVRLQGVRFGLEGEVYELDGFPATRALVEAGEGSFLARCGDSGADKAECELLEELGYHAAIVACAADRDGAWLLELYGDDATRELEEATGLAAVLARAAVPPVRRLFGGRPDAADRQARRLELLMALSRRLGDAERDEERLELAVEELQRALRPEVASILELLPGNTVKLAAYRSDHVLSADWTQPADTGLVGRCISERAPVLVGDVRAEPEYRGRGLEVRTELDVPIFVGEQVWGVINVESRDEDAFDAEDVRAVESAAALLGSALGRGDAT